MPTRRPARPTDDGPAGPSSVPDEPVAGVSKPTPPPAPLQRRQHRGEAAAGVHSPLRPRSLLPAFERLALHGDSDMEAEGDGGQRSSRPQRSRAARGRTPAGSAAPNSKKRGRSKAADADGPSTPTPSSSSSPLRPPAFIESASVSPSDDSSDDGGGDEDYAVGAGRRVKATRRVVVRPRLGSGAGAATAAAAAAAAKRPASRAGRQARPMHQRRG